MQNISFAGRQIRDLNYPKYSICRETNMRFEICKYFICRDTNMEFKLCKIFYLLWDKYRIKTMQNISYAGRQIWDLNYMEFKLREIFHMQVDKYGGLRCYFLPLQFHCKQDLRPQPPILKSRTQWTAMFALQWESHKKKDKNWGKMSGMEMIWCHI